MDTANDLYEEAIMDCCKKHKILKEFKQLMNRDISEGIVVNGCYKIVSIGADVSSEAQKILRFYALETENFPGVEFKNDLPLGIVEVDEKTKEENFLSTEIVFTFHEDTELWTGFIHLWSLADDGFNKIEKVTSVS